MGAAALAMRLGADVLDQPIATAYAGVQLIRHRSMRATRSPAS
jgi:hypothetical protein